MRRPRFALLPLDDRPANLQFPRRLAAVGGVELRLPPRRLLGRFRRPGAPQALSQWLGAASRGADAAIISCDMLAYGGLVASREAGLPADIAASRVERLRALKQELPRLRIYAFAVIPRLGLTVASPELGEIGPRLARWNELRCRAQPLSREEGEELQRLRAALPRDILAAHDAMRRRNLAVSKQLVALAAQGVVDFLVLAQEDAAMSGPHIAEQAQLRQTAERLGVSHLVRIYPGADEVGMALLARAAGEVTGLSAGVYPLYSTPGGAESVALFEDRPLRMTVAGQVAAAGLHIAPTPHRADIILGLHSPPTAAQTDIGHASGDSAPRAPFVEHLVQLAREGDSVALADVAYCNGADPSLMAALGERRGLPHLAGFAAWNTAANTIGCALAQAALLRVGQAAAANERARQGSLRRQIEFLFERLADDYAYQTVVRPQAYRFARESLGEWPLNLRRGRRQAAEYVRAHWEPAARRLFAEHFGGVEVSGRRIAALRELRMRLPWARLFEVEVQASIGLE